MQSSPRNPHAGNEFDDADNHDTIARMLEDVSVPALLCSLVHMTGDPSWIRGDHRPRRCATTEFQGGMASESRAEVLRLALPVIAAYRDGGYVVRGLAPELLHEMMEFIACGTVNEPRTAMFMDDLSFGVADSGAITWRDEIPVDVRDDAHTVVIGCGESGIVAGIRLAQAGLAFTIIERSSGPGGTWQANRYPGARVDVGSHHYCYSFEPADHWTEYFCRQPELEAYFTRVLDSYDLRDRCRFNTEVLGATWNDTSARWDVQLRDADGIESTIQARFVITGAGSLTVPKLPDIEGMESFNGPSFHSARWPNDLDVAGQRVALVGAGATGFQIAPTIADDVAHLDIFQRTPQWIIPNRAYHQQVPDGDRWAMRHLPFYGRWFRFMMMWPGIGNGVENYRRDPDYDDGDGRAINASSAMSRDALSSWIVSHLDGRPDLIEKSVPSYPPMGKRVLQDNGSWLGCLKKPNVELITTAITRVEPEGVVTSDGVLHHVDVICYATGFLHTEFLAPMDIIGRDGVSLREQWGEEPSAYLGMVAPNFPNLFFMYGPGTNLAQGASLILQSEFQANFAMDAIHQVLVRDARSIEVRGNVHAEYKARYAAEIDQFVWAHPSIQHSHYKNKHGKVWTLSPWPFETYWSWTRSVDVDEFDFR